MQVAGSGESAQPTVMLVDEDPAVVSRVRELFVEGAAGWDLRSGSDLDWARTSLQSAPADVLLVGGTDHGLAWLSALKGIGVTPGRPRHVVFMAAAGEDAQLSAALGAGASDYLLKPFLADSLCVRVELGLRLVQAKRQLTRARARLQMGEMNDRLTSLPNRRRAEGFLRSETERVRRGLQGLGVAVFDLDWFSVVNSQFGPALGDRVLKDVAATMLRASRGYDLLARWDGKVFLVAFPATTLRGADVAARRHLDAIAGLQWDAPEHSFGITASVGLAHAPVGLDVSWVTMVTWAEAAAERAKEHSRGQVVHARQSLSLRTSDRDEDWHEAPSGSKLDPVG